MSDAPTSSSSDGPGLSPGTPEDEGSGSEAPMEEEGADILLFFELVGRSFAVEGRHVETVLPAMEPVQVPGAPPSLEGVFVHQGVVESLIDIAPTLGLTSSPRQSSRSILLCRVPALRSGLRVDRVLDVAPIPASEIEPPAAAPEGADALRAFSLGFVRRNDVAVPLLDLPAILAAWRAAAG